MLDSERVALDCWVQAAADHGWQVRREDCLAMVGLNRHDSHRMLTRRLGPDFPIDDVARDCAARYRTALHAGGIPVKPGLGRLLEHLTDAGIPLAVATSTRRHLADEKLAAVGIARFFRTVVGGDQVARGKPAPDIYLAAAQALGAAPAAGLALEDSPAGVRAAHAAGIPVVLIPDLVTPPAEIQALAVAVHDSLVSALPFVCAHLGIAVPAPASWPETD